ncbi:hypothetical protein ACTABU_23600 [Pseudomonas syringae]|uniref:hypothetical protein n=1 Tax=Pseudomonas syringae TaxID=317 RepID=UPI0012685970|nr:hypothetical protein [Pseudomonas syringae]
MELSFLDTVGRSVLRAQGGAWANECYGFRAGDGFLSAVVRAEMNTLIFSDGKKFKQKLKGGEVIHYSKILTPD